MNSIELTLFSSRVSAICDEMGTVLRRTAFSPNIKDRLDFSCALFSTKGQLFAQAAHIPVHLGSMAFAMESIIENRQWRGGDMLVLNDPYLGGTHLPDVTLIAPVFVEQGRSLIGFVANRAHHANIGCDTPGSMPISSSLEEEGLIIPPTLLFKSGQLQQAALSLLQMKGDSLSGDFAAQAGANTLGVQRLQSLLATMSINDYEQGMKDLNDYADRITANTIAGLQVGEYSFTDYLDDDGCGQSNIKLALTLRIRPDRLELDFRDSSEQVAGNLNCPESVVAAAAFYCIRCLLPEDPPACEGLFRRIHLLTRPGSIVNAKRPAAVAAGNVETSSRLVDLVFGALAKALPGRIPAASQGTMNNVAMGHIDDETGSRWDYYETLAGGIGGGPTTPGRDAVHSHMTNTLNTPIESLEMHYPLRVHCYAVRRGSGGKGKHAGGAGITREYEFLDQAQLSLLCERRLVSPWGLNEGGEGMRGRNSLNGETLPGKCSVIVKKGDRLLIETPGGGAWGKPTSLIFPD
ncbi:MAG: 5-oxoprolinase [SAR86 cluster bacterium]|uniref:5-oxoprolinase n=1 Tax=SAR86 cluster bacterium TaxID=2030880 RepID=A0A2A4WRZ2_9GAMM|nr:MAG: 5-oxoprolinase [SAR86 cluster bacterium]